MPDRDPLGIRPSTGSKNDPLGIRPSTSTPGPGVTAEAASSVATPAKRGGDPLGIRPPTTPTTQPSQHGATGDYGAAPTLAQKVGEEQMRARDYAHDLVVESIIDQMGPNAGREARRIRAIHPGRTTAAQRKPNIMERGASEFSEGFGDVQTPGKRVGGVTKMIRGAAGVALPLLAVPLAAGAVAAPGLTALELAGGVALEYAVPPLLEAAGVPKDWSELGGTVAGFAPVGKTLKRGITSMLDDVSPSTFLGGLKTPPPPPMPKAPGVPPGALGPPSSSSPPSPPSPPPPPRVDLQTASPAIPAATREVVPMRPLVDSVTGQVYDPRQVTIGPERQLAAPSQTQMPPVPPPPDVSGGRVTQAAKIGVTSNREAAVARLETLKSQLRDPSLAPERTAELTLQKDQLEGYLQPILGSTPESQLDLPIGTGRGQFELSTPRPPPPPVSPPSTAEIIDPMIPRSVRSTFGPDFPAPPEVRPDQGFQPPIHQASQGDLFTSGAIDVPPETPVYGSMSESGGTPTPRQIQAGGAEVTGAADATLAARAGRRIGPPPPPPPPMRIPPKLARRIALENMGLMEQYVTHPPQPGVLVNPDERTVLQSYPQMRKLVDGILRRRAGMPETQSKIEGELQSLQSKPPTPKNVQREEQLSKQLREMAPADTQGDDLLIQQVKNIEANFGWAKLMGSYARAFPSKKTPDLKRLEAGSGVSTASGEAASQRYKYGGNEGRLRGNEGRPTRPPREDGDGGGTGRDGTPPPPDKPDLVSRAEEPNPVIREQLNDPGALQRRALRPLEVIEEIGGDLGRDMARRLRFGLTEGRLVANTRARDLIDSGLAKLNTNEAMNLQRVLEGQAEAVTPKVEEVAKVAREILNTISDEVVHLAEEGNPVLIKNADGSVSYFTPMADGTYAPHIIPSEAVLRSSNHQLTKDVLQGMVNRGDAPDAQYADDMLQEYLGLLDERPRGTPSKLVNHIALKQGISQDQAMKLLQKLAAPHSKKFGPIDFSRTLDLPFYDPNAIRSLSHYVEHGSQRVVMEYALRNGADPSSEVAISKFLTRLREMDTKPNADKGLLIKDVQENIDYLLGNRAADFDQGWENLWALIRTSQAFDIGPATTVANSFQATLFGLLRTDPSTVAKAIVKSLMPSERAKAIRAGADRETAAKMAKLDSGAADTSTRAGRWNEKLSKNLGTYMNTIVFPKSEQGQRILGHHIGEIWGRKMAERLAKNPQDSLARRELKDLLLDPDEVVQRIRDGSPITVTDHEALRMGLRMSDILNFSNRPEDIPKAFRGGLMRTIWQFKTFAYGATRLSMDAIQGEVASGQKGRAMRNAATMLLLFPATGEVVKSARDIMNGRSGEITERWEGYAKYTAKLAEYGDPTHPEVLAVTPFGEYFDNIMENGAFAMVLGPLQSGSYGKALEWIAGPAIGSLVPELLEEQGIGRAAVDLYKGDPTAAALDVAKVLMRNAPWTASLVYPWMKDYLTDLIESERSPEESESGSRSRPSRPSRPSRQRTR